jgi:hypothetical protein
MLNWKTTFIRNRVINITKGLSHSLNLSLKKEVFQYTSPPNKVNSNAKKKNITTISINIENILFIGYLAIKLYSKYDIEVVHQLEK